MIMKKTEVKNIKIIFVVLALLIIAFLFSTIMGNNTNSKELSEKFYTSYLSRKELDEIIELKRIIKPTQTNIFLNLPKLDTLQYPKKEPKISKEQLTKIFNQMVKYEIGVIRMDSMGIKIQYQSHLHRYHSSISPKFYLKYPCDNSTQDCIYDNWTLIHE